MASDEHPRNTEDIDPCTEQGDAASTLPHDLSYLTGPPPGEGGTRQTQRYWDGIAANAEILGITKTQLLDSDAQSPFNSIASATSSHAHLPPSLQPTAVQHQFAHHPFFDCIPIPSFRDRAILAAATDPPLMNRFTICFDMFAGGLYFTGDPAAEADWTFSDGFREKWGRLLEFDIAELKRRATDNQR